ncbi:LOW QUALITY PROTEIN: mucin-19-like [Diachasma alloeum]|uniref:LOW QUALITY PROTEIN: mucin-19-like n=1 Tax=Diachasma alloeum TaxID=454923 RepID=UPI0007384276|nr:LOW QUALITY PROTEIN: mucin-19-like [Diachasma alloeum]
MTGLSISQHRAAISSSTAETLEVAMKFLVIVLAIWVAAASAAPERERRSLLGVPGAVVLGGLSPLGLGHAGLLGLGAPGVSVLGPAAGSVAVVGPVGPSAAVVGPVGPSAEVVGPVGPSAAVVGPAAGATVIAGPAGAIQTGHPGLILPGLIHG